MQIKLKGEVSFSQTEPKSTKFECETFESVGKESIKKSNKIMCTKLRGNLVDSSFLCFGKVYQARVRGYNQYGWGSWGCSDDVKTPEKPPLSTSTQLCTFVCFEGFLVSYLCSRCGIDWKSKNIM